MKITFDPEPLNQEQYEKLVKFCKSKDFEVDVYSHPVRTYLGKENPLNISVKRVESGNQPLYRGVSVSTNYTDNNTIKKLFRGLEELFFSEGE